MSVKQGGKTIAGATQYHPDLFDFKWADHILNDAQWLMANTFSWQYGSMYQTTYAHLAADIVGKTLQSETVAGITVQFYLADDGHKICPDSEEDNVLSIYNKTGNAWYYIIDTINQRFKLPRRHSQKIVRSVKNADGSWYRLYADGWVEQGGIINTNDWTQITLPITMQGTNYSISVSPTDIENVTTVSTKISNVNIGTTYFRVMQGYNSNAYYNGRLYWQVSGQSAIDMSLFQDGEKYLYFYVGAFTQTSLENIASIATETLNNKVDKGHQLVEFQEPTAANNYTWYRKYDDGWVEQGGIKTIIANNSNYLQSLPITMADTHYTVTIAQCATNDSDYQAFYYNQGCVLARTTTTVTLSNRRFAGSGTYTLDIMWQVSGIAAN